MRWFCIQRRRRNVGVGYCERRMNAADCLLFPPIWRRTTEDQLGSMSHSKQFDERVEGIFRRNDGDTGSASLARRILPFIALPFWRFLSFTAFAISTIFLFHCFAVLTITLFHCFVLLRFSFASLFFCFLLFSSFVSYCYSCASSYTFVLNLGLSRKTKPRKRK